MLISRLAQQQVVISSDILQRYSSCLDTLCLSGSLCLMTTRWTRLATTTKFVNKVFVFSHNVRKLYFRYLCRNVPAGLVVDVTTSSGPEIPDTNFLDSDFCVPCLLEVICRFTLYGIFVVYRSRKRTSLCGLHSTLSRLFYKKTGWIFVFNKNLTLCHSYHALAVVSISGCSLWRLTGCS